MLVRAAPAADIAVAEAVLPGWRSAGCAGTAVAAVLAVAVWDAGEAVADSGTSIAGGVTGDDAALRPPGGSGSTRGVAFLSTDPAAAAAVCAVACWAQEAFAPADAAEAA